MIVPEDDFDSELERARSLLLHSLGRDQKMDDPDQVNHLRRQAGIVSESAFESSLVGPPSKVETPPL